MISAKAKEDTDPLKSSVAWTKIKGGRGGGRTKRRTWNFKQNMAGNIFLSEPGLDLWFFSIWCWLDDIYSAQKRDDAP